MLKNIHPKRTNRTAKVIAEVDGIVLYNAFEGKNMICQNMVRPSEKFWAEYKK